MNMSSDQTAKAHITILSLLCAAGALLLAPQVFSQTRVFAGYGYGEDCIVEGPSTLSSRFLKKPNKNKIAFRWNAVSFDECVGDALDYYQLQVKYPNGSLVESWTDITSLRKWILVKGLRTNQAYVFRVRAWSVLGQRSTWSLYTAFRTKPASPKHISIINVQSDSVTANWKNVARSRQLQKYRVMVKRDNQTITKANVRKGLKKQRAQVTVTGLAPDTNYVVQVRSVYSKALRSKVAEKQFRTRNE